MDSFVNFLLDYYIWILVVLGIIIVTIIGFLVDSRQKNNKKIQNINVKNGEVATVEPLPEVSVKQDLVNNDISNYQSLNNNVQNINNVNSIKRDEISSSLMNHSNVVSNQGVALSEQKPHFESREVPGFASSQMKQQLNNNMDVPQPINAVSINQPVQQTQAYMKQPQQFVNPTQSVYQSSNYGYVQPYMQSASHTVANSNVGVSSVSSSMPLNNYGVSQQYVQTGYSNQGSNNQPGMAYNSPINNSDVNNNLNYSNELPSYVSNSQSVQTTSSNVGINFVTGILQENDDTWKL